MNKKDSGRVSEKERIEKGGREERVVHSLKKFVDLGREVNVICVYLLS